MTSVEAAAIDADVAVPDSPLTGTATQQRRRASGRWIRRAAWTVVGLSIGVALLGPLLTDVDPELARPAERFANWGEGGHLLGTDQPGRDLFVRLVHGARLAWVVDRKSTRLDSSH